MSYPAISKTIVGLSALAALTLTAAPAAAASTTASASASTSASTATGPFKPGRYYELVLEWGRRCLEGWDSGQSAYQWTCHGGDHQRWRFDRVGKNYKIVNKRNGQCLDVAWGSPRTGTKVILAPCHGAKWQLWDVRNVGSGLWEIVASHSWKCLDISHGGAGSIAHQWDCHHRGNQQWIIR